MNEARFLELLATYGAELGRWPSQIRDEAESYLVSSPHRVKDVWESERLFDGLLALDTNSQPSIALETAILRAAPSMRRRKRWSDLIARPSFPRWATGATVAACLAVGFVAGYLGSPAEPEGEYAQLLALQGAGAGAVFLSAIDIDDQ